MSEKNRDNKNRWRNVTIAFRMSPEENEELNLRVKLCGYQTRQEYIIESVLHQKVTAVGNPLMLVQFRKRRIPQSGRIIFEMPGYGRSPQNVCNGIWHGVPAAYCRRSGT